MNSLAMKAAALALLGVSIQVAGQLTFCEESENADFDYEVTPASGTSLFWSIDADAATVSFQMVSDAAAWLGLGFPETDLDVTGAEATIGLPANDSVLEYDLTGPSAADAIPFDVQDITDATVVQDATGTTMSFTRPLAPGGEKQNISTTPGDVTTFIYAVGTDNELAYDATDNPWAGFRLDVFCGSGADDIVERTPAPAAPVPTDAPTPAPAAAGGTRDITIDDDSVAPSVSPDAGSVAETQGPTTLEEADGQGDSAGAFRVGGGGLATPAVVATGVAAVLAVAVLFL